ncbi:MAG: hypothetical protein UY63_C0004G0025 [Parcubacteria group bacterium GW2011_GWA2_51_10]|nr:MAG: hypothetical protein UY63_C0004G0025 [Parcubacteria group bacterium GW2011_GWA2_51_10]
MIKKKSTSAGLTLIELVVAVGIFALITGIILANNTRFGGIFSLQNLAYSIALSIREAQAHGISVSRYSSGYETAFGMHFDVSSPASRLHYELFADSIDDGYFETSENVPPSPYTIGRGYTISKLCAPAGNTIETCTSVERLDIIFRRPEPDASIRANSLAQKYESGRIVVQSPRGDQLSILVLATGGISVQR